MLQNSILLRVFGGFEWQFLLCFGHNSLTPSPMNLHEQFVSLNFQIIGMKNKLMVLLLEIYQKEI